MMEIPTHGVDQGMDPLKVSYAWFSVRRRTSIVFGRCNVGIGTPIVTYDRVIEYEANAWESRITSWILDGVCCASRVDHDPRQVTKIYDHDPQR